MPMESNAGEARVTIIASVARNGVIGKDGGQPLFLKEDLKRFRRLTVGGVVVMGRKTFEAILAKAGKPLGDRINIVITRQKDFAVPAGVVLADSVEAALAKASSFGKPVFVIGGQQVFSQTLALAYRLELTEIDEELDGDAFFPQLDKKQWRQTCREAREEGGVKYAFVTYERKR